MNRKLQLYAEARAGSVSVVFAIALLALILAAGSAVDYARYVNWQSRIQLSTDAAALAAASLDGTLEQRKAAIERFFAANFVHDREVSDTAVDIQVQNDEIAVIATASLKTSFLGIAGISSMDLRAESGASAGGTTVEIALVLDVSGSMRHPLSSGTARIDVLKKAARQLVDIVTENGRKSTQVKIAIIPFNMTVNVGTKGTNFIQGDDNTLFARQAWAGCVLERPGAEAGSDNYDAGLGSTGKWHAYAWPPEPNSITSSCLNRSNGTNSGYAAISPVIGFAVNGKGPNFNCVRHPIMPLTGSYPAITAKIDELTAEWNQGTIIAPGVSWGLRVLSPGQPFTEGRPYATNVKKYLVVLTDGEQTTEAEYGTQGSCYRALNTSLTYKFDPASLGLKGDTLSLRGPLDTFSPYGYIRDSDPFNTNPSSWSDVSRDLYNLSLDACTTVKRASAENAIEVFSIAVSSAAGDGTTVGKLLKACASTPENFFLATQDSALINAFRAIATKISQVRLTH